MHQGRMIDMIGRDIQDAPRTRAGIGKDTEVFWMAMPFDPIEVDDLDESMLEEMTPEEMAEFREKLLATLDEMETFEPDIDEEEDEYYEWEDRINVLHDLIDIIDDRIGE